MSSRSPIFPMAEPHHYSDYGFDPQMDYFQVLEEARRHGKRSSEPRSPDAIHFTLRKPISKDDRGAKSKKRRKWWKAALLFWKRDTTRVADPSPYTHRDRVVSGPVYMIESGGSGSSTPCRTGGRPWSGPLRAAEAAMPYLSLRELNLMEDDHHHHHHHRMSASAPAPMPMYLVT